MVNDEFYEDDCRIYFAVSKNNNGLVVGAGYQPLFTKMLFTKWIVSDKNIKKEYTKEVSLYEQGEPNNQGSDFDKENWFEKSKGNGNENEGLDKIIRGLFREAGFLSKDIVRIPRNSYALGSDYYGIAINKILSEIKENINGWPMNVNYTKMGYEV
ncbi:MAG: hypothetical protein GWP09_00630 [Nitrospiraceae bacterium]|nr:hypothetical protein [Nitrospiraceae bacterium]